MDTDKKVDELMDLLFEKSPSSSNQIDELMDMLFEREFPFEDKTSAGSWVGAITSGNAAEAEAAMFFGGFL